MKIGDKVQLIIQRPLEPAYYVGWGHPFRTIPTEVLGEPQEVFDELGNSKKVVLLKGFGLLDMSWIKKVEYLNTDGEEND